MKKDNKKAYCEIKPQLYWGTANVSVTAWPLGTEEGNLWLKWLPFLSKAGVFISYLCVQVFFTTFHVSHNSTDWLSSVCKELLHYHSHLKDVETLEEWLQFKSFHNPSPEPCLEIRNSMRLQPRVDGRFAWANITHICIRKSSIMQFENLQMCMWMCELCLCWFSWMHMTPASSDHRFLFLALLGLSSSCLSSAMSRSIVKREPSGACLHGSYPHQSHPESAQCKETQIPCSHRDQHRLILERGFRNCIVHVWIVILIKLKRAGK